MRIELRTAPGDAADDPTCLKVHPVYGAVYTDGEFVSRGAVIGLSVDMDAVVTAPISGWVRLVRKRPSDPPSDEKPDLRVEIWPHPVSAESASHSNR
jgi:hypothetical protein